MGMLGSRREQEFSLVQRIKKSMMTIRVVQIISTIRAPMKLDSIMVASQEVLKVKLAFLMGKKLPESAKC